MMVVRLAAALAAAQLTCGLWGQTFPPGVGQPKLRLGPSALAPGLNVAPAVTGIVLSQPTFNVGSVTLTLSDDNGFNDVALGYVLINDVPSPANACYLEYRASDEQVRLANDEGTQWLPAVSGVGVSTTIENSACRLHSVSSNTDY